MPPALPVSIYDSRAHPRFSSVSVFLSPGFFFSSSFSLTFCCCFTRIDAVDDNNAKRKKKGKKKKKIVYFLHLSFLRTLTLLQLSVSQTNARSFKRDNQIFLRFRLWERQRGEEQRLVDDRDALYVCTYVHLVGELHRHEESDRSSVRLRSG